MQNITFTGISSLYTGKKVYSKLGPYITPGGILKNGEKRYEEFAINCKFTNDKSGNHLTEFWDSLSKSSASYQARCVLNNSKDDLSLTVKRCTVQDEAREITNSNFVLNGISIMPNDRHILPLFTFLAKFTRELAKQPEISPNRKALLQKANQSIHEEAVRFIENM